MKYVYPILITELQDEVPFFVSLPDFDRQTQGMSLADAIDMGADLLSSLLIDREDSGTEPPAPSDWYELTKKYPEAMVSLLSADTTACRCLYGSQPSEDKDSPHAEYKI
ncbi:MAG: hypothetical protein QM270_05675 [Bacillota bacterium]|nr:hypothetical protein [Bacillota bacterium]